MAAPHLPPSHPDPTKKKIDQAGTAEISTKRPALEVVRSISRAPALQQHLRAVVKKRWLRVAAIGVAVLVVLLIALPFLINVNSFRPRIEAEASTALGRQVTIGNISLSILSGGLRADNIAIADDPLFSKSAFVTAKSLKVGVQLMPLILSKQVNVTDIKLDEPQIVLLKSTNGKWNFSSLGGTSGQKAPDQAKSGESAPTNFSVAKLNVNRGKVSVGKARSSKLVVYQDVKISIKNFSFNSEFPFDVAARLPGSGDLKISGKAGAINAEDNSKTPVSATVKVSNMNIDALGMVDPSTGFSGLANFDGTLDSDGRVAKVAGLFTGKQLKFSSKGTPAPETVSVEHSVTLDLDKQSGTINRADITIGSAQAHVTGNFDLGGDTQVVHLKLDAPNMAVDELQPMLPSVGVVLPSGSQLKGGTLSAQLAISGPLDKLVITGPVRLANTELVNFNLGSQLGALSAFAGKSVSNPNTSIQNGSLDARVAPEGTKADNINLTVPSIGVITGAGTVSPSGALAFRMVADLHGGVVGGLSTVAAAGTGKGGIPFAIEGTTSNPKFIPDVGGALGGVAAAQLGNVAKGQVPGASSVTKGLGGVFKK